MDVDLIRPTRRIRSIVGIVSAVVAVAVVLSGCTSSDDDSRDSASAAVPSAAPTPPVTTPQASGGAVSPTPTYNPPYVDHVEWVQTAVGPSLQVHPTTSGRRTDDPRGADVAWHEVLTQAPDADTPGMRAQFDCHWQFARLVEPNKPSWNLEPSRPVVTDQVMIETRCNPGGPEE
ncbi:DUF2599 domain-containing protein [Gordonia sp. SL306]|uniref:DUF2599 domain-containing protein n=1 Tax=Gordonia sp. SL306 TaxID=2995145 RepID=UPI00226F69C7|nr:DUF2599 domain-containing protein [Gordonia sp. SL306]WAC56852.1 DUF2599 domain-containing protein [Gordonia sp. SL306]